MTATALERARLALDGLSVGDAFDERVLGQPAIVASRIEQRALPGPPWFWTDDTAMALSVFDELEATARMDSSSLAQRSWCAARHLHDFEQALWTTVSGLGDRDTTSAIVALSVGRAGIPEHFLDAREPLDSTLDYIERQAIASELGRR